MSVLSETAPAEIFNLMGVKMRIVQIGPMPPPHGGVAMNMLAIHDALRSMGHDSRIIDVTNRKAERTEKFVIKPRSTGELLKLLASLDCDIVHYHIGGNFTPRLALLAILCGALPRRRFVMTFHSGGFADKAAETASPASLRGLAFRSADLLIGVNKQMIEMFRRFGADENRIRLILPFELKRPEPSVRLSDDLAGFVARFRPLLLSVGALEPEYGNEFLVESFPAVLEAIPEAGLVIVGSGSLEKRLKQRAKDLELENVIFFTGNLEHPKVLRLMERSDILLRLTDYDGDSIAVREALFLGTHVIASDNAKRPNGVTILHHPFTLASLLSAVQQAEEAQFQGHSEKVCDTGNAHRVVEAYRELLGR